MSGINSTLGIDRLRSRSGHKFKRFLHLPLSSLMSQLTVKSYISALEVVIKYVCSTDISL